MKKLMLGLIATISISNLSFGHATFEHSYSSNVRSYPRVNAFNTASGLNYYTFDDVIDQMKIYNSSHVLIKTVNVPILTTGYHGVVIDFPTDNLFNSDNLIEFIISVKIPNPAPATGSTWKLRLVNENGVVLQNFTDNSNSFLVKSPSNEYKLIIKYGGGYDSASGTNLPTTFDIYSLTGTLSTSQQGFLSKQFIGFPNPTNGNLTISNILDKNENANIEVFDINGKIVIEKNVSGENEEINIDTSQLSSGVYIYKLKGETNRFIKQ